MKILYFSDIHLEVWSGITRLVDADSWAGDRPDVPYPLSLGPDLSEFKNAGIDVVVLAGDIGTFTRDPNIHPMVYADQVSHYLNCEVILVPGNHEYYGCNDIFDLIKANRKHSYNVDRVHLLDNRVKTIDGVRFIGSTLWTDYRLLGWEFEADCMRAADVYMADHRGAIRKTGKNGGKKNFTPQDALQLHKDSAAFIEHVLTFGPDEPTVIVTHHVPLLSAETKNPRFPVDATTAGFMSHLPRLVELAADTGAKAWIFGHHHYSLQSEAYGVKMLSAQLGYPTERANVTGWNGPQILEI